MLLTDPWFWAFLAAIGWGLGFGIIGTQKRQFSLRSAKILGAIEASGIVSKRSTV